MAAPTPGKVRRVSAPEPTQSRPAPLLTVVVVNFNSWPDVGRLVTTLAASPEVVAGACEIVVVDNASDGPVPEALRPAAPGVRLILRRDNGGFAVGVNAGWRASRSPWLLILNPDVVVDTGLIGRVLERAGAYRVGGGGLPGVVGFGLRNPDGTKQPSVGAFPTLSRTAWEQFIPRSRRKYQPDWRTRPGPVDWVTGACMMVSAAMLAEVGGMDEEFFLYYEEVALCRSARSAGWRVEYDPSVEVVHLRPLQNRPVSPKMRVITRHSKLLYFRKHLPRWQFESLCGLVAVEARLRAIWARRSPDARAWRTIAGMAGAMRSGSNLGGRAVLALAESIEEPDPPAAGPRRGRATAKRAGRPGRPRGPRGSRTSPIGKDGSS